MDSKFLTGVFNRCGIAFAEQGIIVFNPQHSHFGLLAIFLSDS